MTNEIQNSSFNIPVTSLEQGMAFAQMIADSDLAPKDYKGKPGNCLIAMQFGAEIGLKPLQAIQNIAIINGRPCIWGDAALALVLSNPLCEFVTERQENGTAYCTTRRRGDDKDYTYEFSKEDAKIAQLTGKPGPWTQYPERMLQMRARGFCLRDKYPDILKGISTREEMEDYVIETRSEESKAKATVTLDHLIESKSAPSITYEDVHCMMTDAQTMEDLDHAASFAKELSEEDKNKARDTYKEKYLKIVAAQTGELSDKR